MVVFCSKHTTDSMMYEILIFLELLALANFIFALPGQPLEYRSLKGPHFIGGLEVIQENNMPLLYGYASAGRGPFPQLDGSQHIGGKERPLQNGLENALAKKGYSKIEGGKNKLVPLSEPRMQISVIPYTHPKPIAQNAKSQTIRDNNNVLEFAERGRGLNHWRYPVGKSLQQLIPIYEFPFLFHEPERKWHSNAGQPSQPALPLREPLGVKKRRIQNKLENTLSKKGYGPSKIDESLNKIDGVKNESPVISVTPRYSPRMQVAEIPYAHPTSSAQNTRGQTIKGDNNVLGLAERGRGHDNGRNPVEKRLQQPIWKLSGSLFPEPAWIPPISGDRTVHYSFHALMEQIPIVENGKNDNVLPIQLPRENLGALLPEHFDLGGPGGNAIFPLPLP